ncbi:unnamed protein product [Effrenium voratum]|uniref:Uncharacterized protein n=1 Tax=Effrenium voratum TaxID=2562239 RepID=A0AA36J058_9DINO|nr:unnamed protein product [Effrenium voratum]
MADIDICSRSSRSGDSPECELDTEQSTVDPTLRNLKQRRGCCDISPLNAACCCHCFYVCQFLIFMVVFPLWTKWLVSNPMPTQYWHEAYPSWPAIAALGGQDLAAEGGMSIDMSPLPTETLTAATTRAPPGADTAPTR